MTKLLAIDLSSTVPAPEARPHQADLNRLFASPGYGLCQGQSQGSLWGRVRVSLVDDRERPPGLTDFMLTVPFYIVSQRFCDVLKRHDCKCEFLPLEVTYKRKASPIKFFALNVLKVEKSAADLDRSVFDTRLLDLGLMREVKKLVLKDGPLAGASMGYLREVDRIAVSEELASDLASLVGVRFVDPERFTS